MTKKCHIKHFSVQNDGPDSWSASGLVHPHDARVAGSADTLQGAVEAMVAAARETASFSGSELELCDSIKARMGLGGMTRAERSLLLYFETCAVDFCGRVDARRMNGHDFEVAERWSKSGFCGFGRIITADHNNQGANWVELSAEAWKLAHEERLARFNRNPRRYTRTSEKHGDARRGL